MVFGFVKKAGKFLADKIGKAYNRFKEDPLGAVAEASKFLTGIDPTADIQQIAKSGKDVLGGIVQGVAGVKKGLKGDIIGGLADVAEGAGRVIGSGEQALGQASALGGKLTKGFASY